MSVCSETTLLYLAYGSNLHPIRLQQRVPPAVFQGRVRLPGYRLEFNKRGMDGSGKCNIQYTGEGVDEVFAVVYSLSPREISVLDRFEGAGYEKEPFVLDVGGERRQTFAYVASSHHCDDRLLPFDWYQQLVFWGGRYHGFPSAYLERLRQVAVVKDENTGRRALSQGLLEQMKASCARPGDRMGLQPNTSKASAWGTSRG